MEILEAGQRSWFTRIRPGGVSSLRLEVFADYHQIHVFDEAIDPDSCPSGTIPGPSSSALVLSMAAL